MTATAFAGAAKRLDAIDVPREAARLGVGEDELRAVMTVEARSSGFDSLGRPAMLFEPHVFYRELGPGAKRDQAVAQKLACASWGGLGPYPRESYSRLIAAQKIDPRAALRSCSWGLGQVMGFNHSVAGFDAVEDMVAAFMDDEGAQLRGMVEFIKTAGLADELARHDWAGFARGYNGPAFAKYAYDRKLAEAFKLWQGRPDTPTDAAALAALAALKPEAATVVATPALAPEAAELARLRGIVAQASALLATA